MLKKIRAQTDIAKKQCQHLDDTHKLDKIIKKEKPTLKTCNKSDWIHKSIYSLYKYFCDIKKFDNLSL